jgi:hypothetical protein
VDVRDQLAVRAKAGDWTKPAAMAIPKLDWRFDRRRTSAQ